MLLLFVTPAAAGPTGTSQSFSASSGCDIGHDATADKFAGRLQHLAIYDAALPAVTALAHYQQGITHTPEELTYEDASEDVIHRLYAYDADGVGIGWVTTPGTLWAAGMTTGVFNSELASSWENPPTPGGGAVTFTSDSTAISAAATEELRRHQEVSAVSFVTQIKGWTPHQAVVVKDARLTDGVATSFDIKTVSGEVGAGGVLIHRITAGAVPRSLVQTVSGQ